MFTNLLNFIRPTKTEKPGIGSTHIQESLGINQEHDTKQPLMRRFKKKKKKILGENAPHGTNIKDAFDVSLEAIYAAITHQAPHTEASSHTENKAIEAYQKNMPTAHNSHEAPETAPWHEKTEKEQQTDQAIQQIDLLLAHDITHIFVKEGQSYYDALNEAIAYHHQKMDRPDDT